MIDPELFGVIISFLITFFILFFLLVSIFSDTAKYLFGYEEANEKKMRNKRLEKELADWDKIKNAHEARTQYPPPSNKASIINVTKKNIVITETVYAD